jgi:hypothetical protein
MDDRGRALNAMPVFEKIINAMTKNLTVRPSTSP